MTNRYDIIWLDTVDSTNEAARRQISDIDNLSVLSALEQTSGKGQKGNRWSSARGENLTFSIVLKFSGPSASCRLPSLLARNQFLLTEIASLSVIDLLSRHGISAEIKWPNDIYVGNKKICGMLIENSLRGQYLSSSIIGIGLNVNQRNFDVNLPNPTSMLLCNPSLSQQDLPELLEEFIEIFRHYHYRCLYSDDGPSYMRKLYLKNMWRYDIDARYMDMVSGQEFSGRIKGLSDIGLLIVKDTNKGEIREFAFKEIGYIL